MDTTSASLLARVRDLGDATAWSQFVRVYSPMLYGWVRQMGLQHDDAVDLVQDVFAVVVQQIPEFDYDAHKRFRGWLWTVTRRRWVEKHRRAVLPLEPGQNPDGLPAPDNPEAEEAEFRNYIIRQLIPTLRGKFHESTWKAFWQHVVENRSASDVAADLGLTVFAVYKAKVRVTAYLHEELADLLDK
ncbi:RNA polymerase sigma factor [Zavarzinella formosa]|uniref:RNA polymerase sigma factor n=1 Tax=Zavarzinella formosa TaxID=360055 RepID=UPI00037A3F8D|nr:sigma-70 family RNA polymerase sigma factor [Zavarzinella formosa]